MIRKAILIGNNTGYKASTFLKGVTKDLENYRNYLVGGIGGGWVQREIDILHNKSKRDILSAIKSCYADYSFVVFSGHGFVNSRDGLTYICVEDGFISEDELNTYLDKQTLILDCCREESTVSNFIGDTGEYFEKAERTAIAGVRQIVNARAKFDNALAVSNQGRFTGYACLTDQLSGDNPTSGGVFSSALLRAGLNFGSKNSDRYTWLAIKAAMEHASSLISSNPFSTQQPEYLMVPGNMSITYPFALTNQIQRTVW